MRILGTINDQSFIAQVSTQEIDFLAGKQIGSSKGYYGERQICAGTTFNIVEAFNQIHRNDKRKREVESLRATLNAMIVGLDMIEPLIDEPKLEASNGE